MSDADEAAVAAGTLARFAERVRDADRPATGSSADRVRRLFARAALARRWPSVRALFADRPPTSDASLTATAREVAKQCQADQKGGLWGWPREAKELLSKAADRLNQLANRLDAVHVPTGVLAQLDRVFARWTATDPLTAKLVHLDTLLASQSDACREFAHDLDANPFGHVFDHFDAKLGGWTPDARAATAAVCVILDRLTQRTSDLPVWAAVRKWAEEWFRESGGNGAVLLEGTPPPAGAIVEGFPLQDPGRRVVLAVVPPEGVTVEDDGAIRVGADGTAFDWPAAVSRIAEVPFGTVVEVIRPDPADPRLVVSDGPLSPAFAAFHDLFAATADRPEWWDGGRWQEARRLTRSPRLVDVAALAGYWLDECRPAAPVVDAVCRWVEACGLAVVRADAPDTPGVTVRQVFDPAEAGTVVGSNAVGFGAADEVFRPAVVEVSLGPPPAGFTELQRAAGRLPPTSDLRMLVEGLQEAAEGNYLREAVLRLYTDYWGEAGESARAAAPPAAAEVGERLNALLADAYGLQPFYPVNVHDLPSGWITVAAGSRVMTGVVTRVLRPGLQDDHGNLRIPAVVEVE